MFSTFLSQLHLHVVFIQQLLFFFRCIILNFRPSLKNSILYGMGYYILLKMIPSLLLWGSDLTGSDYSTASTWGNFTGPAINIIIYVVSMWLIVGYQDILWQNRDRGGVSGIWREVTVYQVCSTVFRGKSLLTNKNETHRKRTFFKKIDGKVLFLSR